MLKEYLEKNISMLGDLTDELKKYVCDSLTEDKSEKEVLDYLKKAGIEVEEERFVEYLKSCFDDKEKAILLQDISEDELSEIAGGDADTMNDCVYALHRPITLCPDVSDFPRCASTVESGSWCSSNDACHVGAVAYYYMKSCSKAHR